MFLFSPVSSLRRFCDDRSGGVAIIFGLMFIVMVSIIGAAIDMGRAMTEQTQLQASLDAAVLDTAAKSRRIGSNVAEDGKHSFDHSWKQRHGAQQPSAAFTRHEGGVFKGKATTTVPTIVLQLFGLNEIQISAESEVKSKSQTAEIALVVDNTWSMNGTKIETLKNSARLLVDTVFEGVEQPGALKVSIVPFSQYVNVGLSNRNQPWLSVENDSSTTSENCNWHQPTRCVRTRTENYTQWIDGIPYARTRTVCAETVNDGPRVWRCTTSTNHRRWSGCVGSRNVPLNTQDTSFTGATTIPGLMNVTQCPRPITPLTDNKNQLISEINQLNVTTSNSETYTQPGVLWGWYTLSSTGPFDQGVARGTEGVRKILVFMTDGANTRSPNYPTHNNDARSNAGNRTTANNLTTQTCANARASDIEIFSIAFDIDDPEIKDVVRQCASDASKFMDAQDSAQLMQAFADISAYIRNLFISH